MTQPLVLVTGGAGFLGSHVCRYLLGRGYAVRSLDTAPFKHPERGSIDVMRGDIRDAVLVGHAMRGVAGVVHTASAAPAQRANEIFFHRRGGDLDRPADRDPQPGCALRVCLLQLGLRLPGASFDARG